MSALALLAVAVTWQRVVLQPGGLSVESSALFTTSGVEASLNHESTTTWTAQLPEGVSVQARFAEWAGEVPTPRRLLEQQAAGDKRSLSGYRYTVSPTNVGFRDAAVLTGSYSEGGTKRVVRSMVVLGERRTWSLRLTYLDGQSEPTEAARKLLSSVRIDGDPRWTEYRFQPRGFIVSLPFALQPAEVSLGAEDSAKFAVWWEWRGSADGVSASVRYLRSRSGAALDPKAATAALRKRWNDSGAELVSEREVARAVGDHKGVVYLSTWRKDGKTTTHGVLWVPMGEHAYDLRVQAEGVLEPNMLVSFAVRSARFGDATHPIRQSGAG